MYKAFINLTLLFSVLLFGCGEEIQGQAITASNPKISYEKVVDGLRNPWGMAFLPNGDILITEIDGAIRIIRDDQLLEDQITGGPNEELIVRGQGGLLDIALHPDFENNRWVYLSYSSTEGDQGSGGNTAIARYRLEGNALTNKELLYLASPNSSKAHHYGSRFAFDDEGYLYFAVGDRGDRDVNPQDITRDMGKIYRIHDDGRIPADNPFVNDGNAKEAIYSFGHRNPQGLAKQPSTGLIWSHEHGPQGGDEVNLIEAGKNYGWPVISYGINYDGSSFTELTAKEGMEQPKLYWDPSIAPCGMTFVTGDRYPGWEGDLVVGSLKFGYLVHVDVDGTAIVGQEKIAEGIGRVRNVAQGPDGYLYVGVEGDGLYRLVMN